MKYFVYKLYKFFPDKLRKTIKKALPKGLPRKIWYSLLSSKKSKYFLFDYQKAYGKSNAYETYLDIQKSAFERKIDNQWETKENIIMLSDYLNSRFSKEKIIGICHGTRTGSEQRWFNEHLYKGSYVFGTDIGSDLEEYEDTIYFDMNEDNLDWKNKFNFIYSNSWDHSFNPVPMLANWYSHLKQGGIMILNHTATHSSENYESVSETDPVAISSDELINILQEIKLETFLLDGFSRNNDESLKPWIYVCGKKDD